MVLFYEYALLRLLVLRLAVLSKKLPKKQKPLYYRRALAYTIVGLVSLFSNQNLVIRIT